MSNKGRLLKIKRMLAVMLAVILAFPSTGVAQSIGAGTVKAWASSGTDTIDLSAQVDSPRYINTDTTVTVSPQSENYYVYANLTGVAPTAVEDNAVVDTEVWGATATETVTIEGNESVTVYYWETKIKDDEGTKKYDGTDTTNGSVVYNIDTIEPEITDFGVVGNPANDTYSDIPVDEETVFNRLVSATDGTATISVAATGQDEIAYSDTYSGELGEGVSEEGVVTGIGSHTITITASDLAGNTPATQIITVNLWLEEDAITVTPETIKYDGEAVDSSDFAIGNSTKNTNTANLLFSENASGSNPSDTGFIIPGTYYVKASREIDDTHYATPAESEWTEFTIQNGEAAVATEPTLATGLKAGSNRELVSNLGSATNGTIYFAASDTELNAEGIAGIPESEWKTSSPKRKNAGTYYVYYYVKGSNEYYDDTEKALLGNVVLAEKNSGNSIAISGTEMYGETLTATITETNAEAPLFEEKLVTYTWTVTKNDEDIYSDSRSVTIESDEDYTNTFEVNNVAWVGGVVKVSAKVENYAAISDNDGGAIQPISVTPSLAGTFTKEYDGDANITDEEMPNDADITLTGILAGDTDNVSVGNGVTYAYDSKNVGDSKTVTASNLSLTGDKAAGYQLSADSATTTGAITEKSISVTDFTFSTGYYITKKSSENTYTEVGTATVNDGVLIENETATLAIGSVALDNDADDSEAGDYTGTVTYTLTGTNAGNYVLSTATKANVRCLVTGAVTLNDSEVAAALKLSDDLTKEYDAATAGEATITLTVESNDYDVSVGFTYDNKNQGTDKDLTFTGTITAEKDSVPYEVSNSAEIISYLNALTDDNKIKGTITPKELTQGNLTISGTTLTKTYDGNALSVAEANSQITITINDSVLFDGDTTNTVTISALSAELNSTECYENTTGSATLSVTDTNYTLSGDEGSLEVTASITPRELAVTSIALTPEFSETLATETVKQAIVSAVTNKVGEDTLNLTVKFSTTENDAAPPLTTIPKEGVTYYAYVTATGNNNYAVPAANVGTVTATAATVSGTIEVSIYNDTTANKYEYGETLTASVSGYGDELKGKEVTYKWTFTPTSGDPVEVTETRTLGSVSNTAIFNLVLDNSDYIDKKASFSIKADGYNTIAYDGSDIEVKARTITPLAIAGSAYKVYDGTGDLPVDAETNTVSGLTVTFAPSDIYTPEGGDPEDVTVVITAGKFKSGGGEQKDADDDLDVTVADEGFLLSGVDSANYRLASVTSLTGSGIGEIGQVVLGIDNVSYPDTYYLEKKKDDDAYTQVSAGDVVLSTGFVTGETLTLTPTLTKDDIALNSGEHGEPGTYYGAVKFTLGGETAANYTFSSEADTQEITISNIKCLVMATAAITPANVVAAITAADRDKVYDGNNKGSITVSVEDTEDTENPYSITVDFTYNSGDANANPQALTFSPVIVKKGDIIYSITNINDINSAISSANFTGTITPKELTADNIEGEEEMVFTKEYDGEALDKDDEHTPAAVTVTSGLIGEDACTVSIASVSFPTDDGTVQGVLNGTAVLSLSNGNYKLADSVATIGITGEITAKELEFNDLTSPQTYKTSGLVATIRSDATAKIKSGILEGSDSVLLTLKFSKTEDIEDATAQISEAGKYYVFVTDTGNENYSAPSTYIGTVQVIYGALSGTVRFKNGNSIVTAANVGDTITAEATGLDSRVTAGYTWYDNTDTGLENPISTEASLTLTPDDLGKTFKVVVVDTTSNFSGSINSTIGPVAAKEIAVTAGDFAFDEGALVFNNTATREATITNEGMEPGYYGKATVTFASASAGAIPQSVGSITVYKTVDGGSDVTSTAYTLTYDATNIETDFANTAITQLTAETANATDLIYTSEAGTNLQKFKFNDYIAAALTDLVNDHSVTLGFGTVTVAGSAASYIADSPSAALNGSDYELSYALVSDLTDFGTEDLTAVFTIPITDTDANYLQNVVLTLTVSPKTKVTVAISSVNTNNEVTYGGEIVPAITINGEAATAEQLENITLSYQDSEGHALSQAPTAVGTGYKVIATYDDGGTSFGVSEAKEFAIVAAEVTVPTFTDGTYDGTLQVGLAESSRTNNAYTWNDGSVFEAYNAGSYTATASLSNDGYKWSDNSTDDKTITWNVGKANSGTFEVGNGVAGATESITGLNAALKYQYAAISAAGETPSSWSEVTGQTSITGLTAGLYAIRISDSNWESSATATVKEVTVTAQSTPTPPGPSPSQVAVTGISLDKTSATLLLSENKIVELTATVAPSDASNKGVNWTVSPAGVVTLSASTSNSGTAITVTAVKEGTATVTATAAGDATKSATATITVNGEAAEIVEVTGISISPATITVEEKGTTQLTAVFAPENQTENPEVTWTSSDATIATVDSTGKVTGVKEGSATITAKVTGTKGEFSATSAVTVTKKIVEVNSISLSATMLTVKKGTSAALTATVLPADATDPSVTWTSGDSAIATVENGTVTGVKAGTTSISAKAGNQTAVAIVTVTEDDAEEEEEQEDLSDLIKDTEDGKKLPEVIKDVIENTEDGTVTNIWVGGLESSYTYTGSAIKPVVHVYDGVRQLAEKTDYTVSYKDNKNAGTSAKIIIKFKGNYNTTPEQTVNFTIAPIDLAECEIPDVAVKEKSAPKFSVIYAGKAQPAKAYNVSYDTADIKKAEAGEYTATFTAKDTNYTGTNTCTVTVIGKNDKNRDLENAKIKLSSSKPTWTGEAIEPSVTVTDAGGKTVDPSLYEVSYQNNVDPGKAMVIVTANDSSEGGYVGAKTATFTITKGKTGGIEISIDESVEYSAAGAQAAVTVTDSETGEVLKKGVDYTVKYSNNKAVTKAAEAKIKGKGNYKFNETKTFAIVAKDIADASFSAADVVGANKWNKSKLTITDGGKNVNKKDYKIKGYKVNGSDATSAAEGDEVEIIIEGSGSNYTGEASATYHVIAKANDISKAKAGKIADKTYTGSKVTLKDSDLTNLLTLNGKTLVPGTDFEVAGYAKNDKKGTAKVTLKGIENGETLYGGLKTVNFKIVQKKGSWKSGGKTLIDGEWK